MQRGLAASAEGDLLAVDSEDGEAWCFCLALVPLWAAVASPKYLLH